MKIIPCGTVLVLGLLMGACTTNISPDTYSVDSVGSVTRSVPGVIVSSRPVNVEGTQKIGGVTGAVAGGVAGSAIGGGDRAHALGAIGAAVIGALAGSAIEKGITNQTGIEYVVKTDNGELLTLVQGPSPAFSVGQKVMILYGKRARIVAQ